MMAITPADGWDDDERAAMDALEPRLRALRARHAGDPPVEQLRAAQSGVLPEPLQRTAEHHLANSPWGRALVEGLDDADEALEDTARADLLDRVKRQLPAPARTRVSWVWPALAPAAVLGLAVTWSLTRTARPEPAAAPERSVAVATPPPAPAFHVKLEKPDVKLSAAALTWRGAPAQSLLTDLKPALSAFRADDYPAAERAFSALTVKYPAVVDVFYYQGVSRLFLNDARGASESLAQAAALADAAFAADVAWYRAAAAERAGRIDEARTQLTAVCQDGGARAAAACAVLRDLK